MWGWHRRRRKYNHAGGTDARHPSSSSRFISATVLRYSGSRARFFISFGSIWWSYNSSGSESAPSTYAYRSVLTERKSGLFFDFIVKEKTAAFHGRAGSVSRGTKLVPSNPSGAGSPHSSVSVG